MKKKWLLNRLVKKPISNKKKTEPEIRAELHVMSERIVSLEDTLKKGDIDVSTYTECRDQLDAYRTALYWVLGETRYLTY